MLKTALSCWICMSCKFFHAGTNMGIVFNSNWFQRGINIFQTCRHWHPTYKPAVLKPPPQYLLYSWTAVWSRVSINKSARCIFLTLGSHGKICFKLGMDTVSKTRPPDYFLRLTNNFLSFIVKTLISRFFEKNVGFRKHFHKPSSFLSEKFFLIF